MFRLTYKFILPRTIVYFIYATTKYGILPLPDDGFLYLRRNMSH